MRCTNCGHETMHDRPLPPDGKLICEETGCRCDKLTTISEANAKKAKAWDELVKKIQAEMVESDKEGNVEARDAFYTVESWMQDLLQM